MISKKIYKAIQSGIREAGRPENLKDTADYLVDSIKQRTRFGVEVKKENTNQVRKFKPLAYDTVRKRRNRTLSSKTTANLSNQTMTGEMVDSLHHKTTRNNINITVSSDNFKKLKGNQELGRNFLKLSGKNLKTTVTNIVSFIAAKIEKNLN